MAATLTAEMVNAPARAEALARLEERINAQMMRVGDGLLEVGRCLNEAKERELIPHGKWQTWVREQTGMDERTAQNWMRAAREIPADSPIARLGKTKIIALLSLPAPEREEAAREMDAQSASTREVQRAVAERNAMRKERDEALRQIGAIRDARGKEMDAMAARLREAGTEREALIERLSEAKGEMDRLREEARRAREAGAEISPKARQRIESLEQEFARLADKYDEAQDEIAQLRRRRSGASESEGMTLDKLCTACGQFMGAVGGLPQMLNGRHLSDADALVVQGQAEMIREWALRVLDSL